MGNYVFYDKPDYVPDQGFKPSFPSDYGFSGPRKVRESKLTEQELKAMQVPQHIRDYCSHLIPEYYMCRKRNIPFVGACKGLVHEYHECQWNDYLMRMKEYEREKRLRIRQKKLEGKTIN